MDRDSFWQQLTEFYRMNNMNFREKKCPSLGSKDLDLYLLYKHVITKGGYEAVGNNPKHKGWEEAAIAVCGSDVLTGPAVPRRCREQYEKRLLKFEKSRKGENPVVKITKENEGKERISDGFDGICVDISWFEQQPCHGATRSILFDDNIM